MSRDTERFKASRNAVFGSCSALVAIQTLGSERRQRSFARAEVFATLGGSLSDVSDETADRAVVCSHALSVMVMYGADTDFD